MALSEEAVLSFLLERGGSVRNSELVCAFTGFINRGDPAEKQRNRDAFKSSINSVAAVKHIDEVKYVVLRKAFRKMVRSHGDLEQVGMGGSLGPSDPPSLLCMGARGEAGTTGADDPNNNNACSFPREETPTRCTVNTSEGSPRKRRSASHVTVASTTQQDLVTARVLKVADGTRTGTRGTLFAIVAQKSPPGFQSEGMKVIEDWAVQVPSSFETVWEHGVDYDPHGSPGTKRRLSLVSTSPAPERGNKPLGPDAGHSLVFPLKPLEHEWIVKSATGHWSHLDNLLLQDVHLAAKRSFISGFSILHWAAKHGNIEMVHRILGSSRLGGTQVDVNIKSHDGYTPLHIAAIHGRESILNALVSDYGASCHIRDNSGKKAYYYLPKDVSPQVRQLLGEPDVWHQVTKYPVACPDELRRFLEVRKGVNTLGKLLKDSVGYGKKFRHAPSFHYKNKKTDSH